MRCFLNIPDEKVLLSDEELWYYVLSKWFIDDSTNEEEWESAHSWLDSLSPQARKAQIVASWEKIFDITPIDNNWYCRDRFVQATFWEIRIEHVQRVWFYNQKKNTNPTTR